MKILCAGLSKTGTTSLHRALGILGYLSVHYDTVRLRDVVLGKSPNPNFRVYDDFDAVLDLPSAFFFEELIFAYPEAKIILTIRDESDWWQSIEKHFNMRSPLIDPEKDPFKLRLRNLVYGSAEANEFCYRKKYREHNQRVISSVSPDKLLVLDVTAGKGWSDLCSFLGVGEPSTPFPHSNKSESEYFSEESQNKVLQIINSLVNKEQKFVLIDHEMLNQECLPSQYLVPFFEFDGIDWGIPPSDHIAVEAARKLRESRVKYLFLVRPAFWWRLQFPMLHAYLNSECLCSLRDEDVVVYAFK